jgi:hypothetical protein
MPEPFAPGDDSAHDSTTNTGTTLGPTATHLFLLCAGCTGARPSKNCPHSQQWTGLAPKHRCGPSTATAVQIMARYAYGVPGLPNWQERVRISNCSSTSTLNTTPGLSSRIVPR